MRELLLEQSQKVVVGPVGLGFALRGFCRACAAGLVIRREQFVREQQHGLREVERRLLGRGRDRRDVVATQQFHVAEAAVLVAEQDRRRAAPQRLGREFARSQDALAGPLAGRRADDPRRFAERFIERRDLLGRMQHVLGLVRHAPRVSPRSDLRGYEREPHEAEVLHRARDAAEVERAARPVQHDVDVGDVHGCGVQGNSRMRRLRYSTSAPSDSSAR